MLETIAVGSAIRARLSKAPCAGSEDGVGSNLELMLSRVRDGEIDFGAFVAHTRTEFRGMALFLMRKWKTPEWFIVDDVEQELYLGAWRCIWKYDADRGRKKGVTFARYIVFNAMAYAKREMHRARGVTVHGNPDKKRSCIETPASFLGDDGEDEALIASILAEGPRAEDEIVEHETRVRSATQALRACTTEKERYAVLAIREAGSVDEAGRLLYNDTDHRITLRLGSEDQAERFVQKHAGAVARRMIECVGI